MSVFENKISLVETEFKKLQLDTNEIQESEFENSKQEVWHRIDYKVVIDFMKIFDDPNENCTKNEFIELLENNNMTVDNLEAIYGAPMFERFIKEDDVRECGYNYGDIFDFGYLYSSYDNSHLYFVGKNSILYKNPDNFHNGGLSVPLVITKYLKDALSKYNVRIVHDIEIGYYDILLDKYDLNLKNDDEHFKRKYVYLVREKKLCYFDENRIPHSLNVKNTINQPVPPEFCVQPWGCEEDMELSTVLLAKMVYDYIVEMELQDPEDKRKINPDSVIKKLFHLQETDEINFDNFHTYMKKLYDRDLIDDEFEFNSESEYEFESESEYQSDSKTDLEDNSYSEDELDSDDDFYY